MSIESLQPSVEMPTIMLWTPNTISTFTFLLGFPSGITLASINWFKIGMREKAFVSIFGGIACITVLFLIVPDNATRIFSLIVNLGYLAYVKVQMTRDIEKITNYKVQNKNWFSGLLSSLLGWGVFLFVVFGVGVVPNLNHYSNGVEYFDKGDYENAITSYTKAIEFDPSNAYAYNNRGLSYLYLGNYDQAIADFNKAMELDPKFDKPYYNRALAYEDLEQASEAIQDLEKVLELTTDPTLLKYAEEELQRLKAGDTITNDGSADRYYNSALAHTENGEYESAIVDYGKVIELDPNDTDAYNNRGICYGIRGEYDRAIADFTKVIELNPHHADAYFNRGLSYKFLGKISDAIRDFEHVLEISIDPELSKSAEEELKILKR